MFLNNTWINKRVAKSGDIVDQVRARLERFLNGEYKVKCPVTKGWFFKLHPEYQPYMHMMIEVNNASGHCGKSVMILDQDDMEQLNRVQKGRSKR